MCLLWSCARDYDCVLRVANIDLLKNTNANAADKIIDDGIFDDGKLLKLNKNVWENFGINSKVEIIRSKNKDKSNYKHGSTDGLAVNKKNLSATR